MSATLPWLVLLDRPALIAVLRHVAGRKFLGVVDCHDAVELVFADGGPRTGNLVTIHAIGPQAGQVDLGGVTGPARYVAAFEEYRREPSA